MEVIKHTHYKELEQFSPVFSSHLAEISQSHDKKTLLCRVQAVYLPVTDFTNLLEIVGEVANLSGAETFIFDNRSLRALRPQCMEWYFRVWKKEMLKQGLKKFRLVLPEEDWLRKTVQTVSDEFAGGAETFPHDTRFCNDLAEALAS